MDDNYQVCRRCGRLVSLNASAADGVCQACRHDKDVMQVIAEGHGYLSRDNEDECQDW